MKKHIGKITVIAVAWLATAVLAYVIFKTHRARAEPLDTYHSSWHLFRAAADEDAPTFAEVYNLTTQGNFANKDSSSVADGGPFRIVSMRAGSRAEGFSPGSKWMLAFCGKNYNNTDDTFSFNVIGWSKTNGMQQNIVEGDGVLGTQGVIVYPDGGDALGEEFSVTDANWTHSSLTLTVTNGGFDGGVVNTMVYVGSSNETNLTSGYYQITTFTDANTIILSGASSVANISGADITVQNNPSFWADTLNIDEKTKYPRDQDANNVQVYNSGDDEVAFLVIETTGLEWIQVVIYAADAATNEEAGAIAVYGRRF